MANSSCPEVYHGDQRSSDAGPRPICFARSIQPSLAARCSARTPGSSGSTQRSPHTALGLRPRPAFSSDPLSARLTPPWACGPGRRSARSEEHTSELQSQSNLVCRLLLEKKKKKKLTFFIQKKKKTKIKKIKKK